MFAEFTSEDEGNAPIMVNVHQISVVRKIDTKALELHMENGKIVRVHENYETIRSMLHSRHVTQIMPEWLYGKRE